MLIRSRSSQRLIRAVNTALAVTLVLLLTPCCEVFAALATAGVTAHAGTLHMHHDDGDTPPAGEHCAPWLDQAFIPVAAALPAPAPPGIDAPPPYQYHSVQYPRVTSVVPHAGAPPPARAVYLLTSRFLL